MSMCSSPSCLAVGLIALVGMPAYDALAFVDDPPDTIFLIGIVRDFRPSPDEHPDFDDPDIHGPYCGSVHQSLDEDGKPAYSPDTGFRVSREWRDSENRKIAWCLYDADRGDSEGTTGAASDGAVQSRRTFSEWFRDVPGVNLSTTWEMRMEMETSGPYAGSYVFETNDFQPFYPIDQRLFGNGGDDHNFYFTFEVVSNFEYDADEGQFLRFKGDDDTWVFINGQLVIDHGGIAGSREYYVDFDRLGLADGETYDVRFFHAERKQPQSQFHLWTNVALEQEFPLGATISAIFD